MALRLYGWPTPNVLKVSILLEELGTPYEAVPVNIREGEQFQARFLDLNPNAKVPVLVDEDVTEGPITVFESGAILIYLAEKHGKYLAREPAARAETVQWLMFQMSAVGVHLISVQKVTVRASPQSEDWRGVCSRGERKCLSRFEFLLVS